MQLSRAKTRKIALFAAGRYKYPAQFTIPALTSFPCYENEPPHAAFRTFPGAADMAQASRAAAAAWNRAPGRAARLIFPKCNIEAIFLPQGPAIAHGTSWECPSNPFAMQCQGWSCDDRRKKFNAQLRNVHRRR